MKLLEVLMRENPDIFYLHDGTELSYDNDDACPFILIPDKVGSDKMIALVGTEGTTHFDVRKGFCEKYNLDDNQWHQRSVNGVNQIRGRFWYNHNGISFYHHVPPRFMMDKIGLLNKPALNLSSVSQFYIGSDWWLNVKDTFAPNKFDNETSIRLGAYIKDVSDRYETNCG